MLIVSNYDGNFMIHLRNLTQNINKYAIGQKTNIGCGILVDWFFSLLQDGWCVDDEALFFIAILSHSQPWYLDMYYLLTIHMHTYHVPTMDNNHVHFSVVQVYIYFLMYLSLVSFLVNGFTHQISVY
jgi:hypothetical protein